MTEKHIIIDDADPAALYGVQNTNLQMMKSLYPKVRITARGNVMHIVGEEAQLDSLEEDVRLMCRHLCTFNQLAEKDVVQIVTTHKLEAEPAKGVVVYTTAGRPVKANTANQQRLIDAFGQNDLVFATGPAGTGKTYLSIALAVRALKERQAKKLILCRPAVEAGEKLGFLPGDMKEKIDPYLQPLYDALEDMLPVARLQEMLDKHIIQIAPLAFMRGRTLSDAVVILDEAQNTTSAQLRMFLTRMGRDTKMIVTGDITQIDLPHGQRSGLREALDLLQGIEGIGFARLDQRDIVRHRLVTRIVNAYEKI